jgi:hypothetical protein
LAKNEKIRVKLIGHDSHTAYVALPGYPEKPVLGVVSKTICLDDLVDGLKGPRVNLDFNAEGILIGIEILVSDGAVE